MQMSRAKELLKNTGIIAIGTFLPKLSGVITLPVITAGLTKAEFGSYDLISTLAALLLPIVTLQLQAAAFRFLIDCRDRRDEAGTIISSIYLFTLPVAALAVLILFFCLSVLSAVTRVLICAYFFLDILLLTTQQVIRGLSRNQDYSASAVIQSLVNLLLVVLLIRGCHWGLNGVLLSITCATGVGTLFLFIRGRLAAYIRPARFSVQALRQLLAYSWPMIPNALSNWVLSVSDRLVLAAVCGIEATAVYSAANRIPALFSSVQGTFAFAWQENASLACRDADRRQYYSVMFDQVFSVLSGLMSLLIACAPLLFRLLIRGDYADAYAQLPFLFMGMFFSALSSFLGGIYVAHKRTGSVGLTTMAAAGINLAIDLALVQPLGIYAASSSTLISYLLLFLYRLRHVQSFQQMDLRPVRLTGSVIVLTVMCVLCWLDQSAACAVNLVLGPAFAVWLNQSLLKQLAAYCKAFIAKHFHS